LIFWERMDYDAELRLHNDVLRRACDIRRHERVLDVGCGAGQTTRDAARIASAGSALGIDTAAAMIARARELAAADGLRNVTFEQGDAQVHRFPAEAFDVAISRFGTMFFSDPIAAFSNIRGALRSGGRLVMMVWQDHASNEWSVSIQQCLAPRDATPIAPPGAPDAFSLGHLTTVERILHAAGLADMTFTDVHEPVYYGEDVAAALDWVLRFASTRDSLHRLDAASAERALERLREMLAAHDTGRGVWLDSRAWIITASCH
jgi:SAM-dependent methyltransferase